MAKNAKPAVSKAIRNEALHAAMVELRRSSAAQRHTPKPRKGTRTAQRKSAIACGW